MLEKIYKTLPKQVRPIAKQSYNRIFSNQEISEEFIYDCFDTRKEYEIYAIEFEQSGIKENIEQAVKKFQSSVKDSRGTWAGIGLMPAKAIYALVRKYEPYAIVETGVCNGVSSLMALSS